MLNIRLQRTTVALTVVALISAVALVACGDDDSDDSGAATPTASETSTATSMPSATEGPGDGAPSEVSVAMTDIAYSVDEIDAVAGEPLTIHFENQGAIQHDFNIDDISVSGVSADGDGMNKSGEEAPIHVHLMPGDEETLTFTPDEPGSYTFYCTQPGHRDAGMEGTLVVS